MVREVLAELGQELHWERELATEAPKAVPAGFVASGQALMLLEMLDGWDTDWTIREDVLAVLEAEHAAEGARVEVLVVLGQAGTRMARLQVHDTVWVAGGGILGALKGEDQH